METGVPEKARESDVWGSDIKIERSFKVCIVWVETIYSIGFELKIRKLKAFHDWSEAFHVIDFKVKSFVKNNQTIAAVGFERDSMLFV